MRASHQPYAPDPGGHILQLQGGVVAHSSFIRDDASPASESFETNHSRSLQELAWLLISILLSLYLATSYVFWAKTESAWPIFRGF
jgi:hypothetical protein